MKMVNNFKEGVKTAAIEYRATMSSINEGINSNPRLALGLGGVKDLTMGTLGTVATIAGSAETGGLSLLAFPLTLGEMGLGLAKIINAIKGNTDQKDPVNTAGTLPGLVAQKANSKNADLIDAAGGFAPGLVTGGNIVGGVKSAISSGKALKEDNLRKATVEGLSAYDAYDDTKKVVQEMKNKLDKK
jgi:hypothetical protein